MSWLSWSSLFPEQRLLPERNNNTSASVRAVQE
jgi:hypothetical protein